MVSKIALEARQISREILASLPFSVRVARALAYVSKFAYQEDLLGYGLVVLRALQRAGIDGPVGRSGIFVSETNKSKQRQAAIEIGKRILHLSRVTKSRFIPSTIQEGIWAAQEKLLRGSDLSSQYTVDQAISYLGTHLRNQVVLKARTLSNQAERRKTEIPDYGDLVMGNPEAFSKVPPRAWKEFLLRVERNPKYMTSDGVNRMRLWLEQVAFEGESARSLATSLGMSEAALRKWVNERRGDLKRDFQSVLKHMDEAA